MDYTSLFELVLPQGILDYFTIVNFEVVSERVDLFLEELPYELDEYSQDEVQAHGFGRESVIQDFPFRDKSLYLHIGQPHQNKEKRVTFNTWKHEYMIIFL